MCIILSSWLYIVHVYEAPLGMLTHFIWKTFNDFQFLHAELYCVLNYKYLFITILLFHNRKWELVIVQFSLKITILQ